MKIIDDEMLHDGNILRFIILLIGFIKYVGDDSSRT